MILEVAILNIKEGLSIDFEVAFIRAEKIIANMEGYISHDLKKLLNEKINTFYWYTGKP